MNIDLKKLLLCVILTCSFSLFAQNDGGFDEATEDEAKGTEETAEEPITAGSEIKIPCGNVIRKIQLVGADHELIKELSEKNWDPRRFKPFPTLEPDETFAIVCVNLDTKKSIGKYDYRLSHKTGINLASRCIAMKKNDKPFSPENWIYYQTEMEKKYKEEHINHEVYLLYKVKQADSYFLQFVYNQKWYKANDPIVKKVLKNKAIEEVTNISTTEIAVQIMASNNAADFPKPVSLGDDRSEVVEPEPSDELKYNKPIEEKEDGEALEGNSLLDDKSEEEKAEEKEETEGAEEF